MEDNSDHAELVRATFESHFALNRLDWVQDGEHALDYLRQVGRYAGSERPHVVLLDLWLSKLSGLETLAEIKSDPALKSIPVVILTSSESERDRAAAQTNHADQYIVKPMDFDRLCDVVDHMQLCKQCCATR